MVSTDKKKDKKSVKKDDKKKVDKKVSFKQNSVKSHLLSTTGPYIISLSLLILACVIYQYATYTPDIPNLNLNKWWGPKTVVQDTSIRPYRIVFSESMEDDFRMRVEFYRRNEKKPASFENAAWTYGVHSDSIEQIVNYWIFKYNFQRRQRFFNQFDQYKTNIQGLDIHYIHVKPKVEKDVMVLPLLLLHGWPGSIREFYEAIPLLTTLRPGYNFVFEVIAPSLPGFGFSQAPNKPGFSPHQAAIVMRNLMQRLGHQHYYIQGGDFGHTIGSHMATIFHKEVLGFHTNWLANFSKNSLLTWIFGSIWPAIVANGFADRMYPLAEKMKFYLEESGYMHLQGTKPDSIGIALQDSPVGLASYILDKFAVFTNPANKFNISGGFDISSQQLDGVLDNIMLYWISGSITTSMRLYKETFNDELEDTFTRIPTSVPTWGLRFKHELFHSPDFVLRWKYLNLVGTTNYDFGGHFAAFEKPKEFSDDVFKAVKSFLELQQKENKL